MRVAGNGVELVPMTFGFPPKNPRGSPVFKASRLNTNGPMG